MVCHLANIPQQLSGKHKIVTKSDYRANILKCWVFPVLLEGIITLTHIMEKKSRKMHANSEN